MTQSFGNIKTSNFKLSSILTNKKFKAFWEVNKDSIAICKDCEYRYSCLDCRAFIDNSNPYSRPYRCKYNPYIAKWKGDEGYKTLTECGVIINEKEYTIDHDKIAKINKELWGEEE